MNPKVDPELFRSLINRRIENYHFQDLKMLVVAIAQALGWADESGVLSFPGSGEAQEQPAKQK